MGEQLSPGAAKATNIVKGDDDDDEAVCLQRGERQEKGEDKRARENGKQAKERKALGGKDCLALKCIMVELSRAPQLGCP